MQDLSQTANLVYYDLGAPIALINQRLKLVCIEFCRRTQAWKETLSVDIVEDQATYALSTAETEARIDRPTVVYVNDTMLQPYDYTWWTEGSKLTLDDTPTEDATGGLLVTVSLIPLMSVTQLPDKIIERWVDVLIAGVKSKMLALYGKPYSDPNGAEHYRRQFQSGMNQVIIQENRNYKNEDLLTPIPIL